MHKLIPTSIIMVALIPLLVGLTGNVAQACYGSGCGWSGGGWHTHYWGWHHSNPWIGHPYGCNDPCQGGSPSWGFGCCNNNNDNDQGQGYNGPSSSDSTQGQGATIIQSGNGNTASINQDQSTTLLHNYGDWWNGNGDH
jgi:hypothetical protein